MKKLFLTSGIIACMACPALADTVNPAGFTGNETSTQLANACVEPTIGAYSGTTTLQADWSSAFTEITLDNNTVANGYGSGNAYSCSLTGTNPCTTENTKIYGVNASATGGNQVWKDIGADGNFTGGVAETGTLLTSTPTGKSLSFTYNYQFPTDSSTGNAYTAQSSTFTAATASNADTTKFNGMWRAATGGNVTTDKFVDAEGKLLAAGLAAAQAGDPITWYAQYTCATPSHGTPALTGYEFNGWSLTANGAVTDNFCIDDGDTETGATRTLYAKWTPNNDTITLDKTTGSADGSPTTLLTTFDTGVYTTARDVTHLMTDTNPTAAQKITVPTGASISLTYSAHMPTNPTTGQAYATPSLTPNPDTANRAFMGFYDAKDANNNGTGQQYIDNNGVITSTGLSAGKKVVNGEKWYAKWGNASFTVKSNLSLTGYDFNGWYTEASGGTQKTGTYSVFDDATLHGQWTAKKYSVTYNKGGTGSAGANYTHTNGATFDSAYTIPTTGTEGAGVTGAKVAASGYTFVGWTTDSQPRVSRDGAAAGTVENEWTGENPWKRTESLTVYAAYIANQGTITYNCGSVSTTNTISMLGGNTQTVTFAENYTLAAGTKCSAPSGYTFGGWSCSATLPSASKTLPEASEVAKYVGDNAAGATTLYAADAGGTWNNADLLGTGVTCTAKWKSNVISINWDNNNATSGAIAGDTCTYSSSVTLPTTPTRTGYTFSGWKVHNTNN